MDAKMDQLLEVSKEILANTHDLEPVLSFLKRNECSKIDSIKIVMQLEGASLGEAKRLVHLSKTWQDVYQRDEEFHDLLERVASREQKASPDPCSSQASDPCDAVSVTGEVDRSEP